MGFWDDVRKNIGNTVDIAATASGSALKNVDFGVSEFLAGGKTANTGRVLSVPGVVNSLMKTQPAKSTQLKTSGNNNNNNNNNNDNGGGAFSTGIYTGGGGYDPVAVAAAAKKAQDNAKKQQLKGEGARTLDELFQLYDQLTQEIQRIGADQSGRINKEFDGKVQNQVTDMNNGMYDTDAGAAANNLADSSFRSFDRGKVRTAADANIKTLNSARESSLGEVGSMVANDTAKYQADKAGIGRTRSLLQGSDDLNEIQSTANTLDATKRGVQADKAKYSTTGEFAQRASKLGNYDTSAIEATLQSVVANASASPATKAATINDLLTGTPLDENKKNELKNKYTQSV